ncbi:SDR family oxidoreductase [Actinoplanes derwentensis]|uniref:NAD(P)-dependent dehydrogenase, short-chain alcohol dehydrogenase family n=1 Tax=Actinoplanes derwentensis TaxID=113562 RepID=A0A1H2AZ97_9ACTN|nr:SDR family oxidoreductase [Actinoplanes derwentensis]GID87215.1 short chain dehydrogenase [Actinoplanes derwentensis]SDT51335.1 NAD(P)-dependent dehydrogenase, short-chain alcohol dehydrogenase family [Actinoplanes derwentensis]
MDPLDFAGRAVVVTGGTRGIGAVIASAFRSAGADVLVCARTSPSAVPPGDFFPADVRDPAQASALVAAAVTRFGRLDVLINNAGGSPSVPAGTASPRLHAKIIELNLIAPLHVSQAANTVMRAQSTGGVILMIGSVSGTRPSPGTAAYGAAKAGLHHLTTSLAAEWAPLVRVNNLVVGPVGASPETPVPGAAATIDRTVPMGRAASPGEVASACLLLASPLAGYITGASLAVHGGGEWPAYLADLRDTAYRAEK